MRMLAKIKYIVMVGGIMLFTTGATAMENTGDRKILAMGCHTHDRICFVSIDGEAIGPEPSCTSNSLRWSADSDVNHNETFSLLTAAFLSGKTVRFNLESECFSLQAAYPTIRYFYVISD